MESNMDHNIVIITTTVAKEQEAHKIIQGLLDKRLAASIQTQEISSSYWEEEKVKKINEWRIMIKTGRNMLKKTLEELLAIHPYDIPEIIVEDVKTHEKYHDWIVKQMGTC